MYFLKGCVTTADIVIENERLKTSVLILNQKLRTQEMEENLFKDKDVIIDRLYKENMALKCDNSSLLQRIDLLN